MKMLNLHIKVPNAMRYTPIDEVVYSGNVCDLWTTELLEETFKVGMHMLIIARVTKLITYTNIQKMTENLIIIVTLC